MKAKLGIDAGFATNRYPEPDDWARIVGEELGLHSVMFVADLMSMFYPDEIISEEVILSRLKINHPCQSGLVEPEKIQKRTILPVMICIIRIVHWTFIVGRE